MAYRQEILDSPNYKVISWGGGVQSTVMAVMSALGDLPDVDFVIHSDTGNEWSLETESILFYKAWLEKRGMNVIVVKPEEDIIDHIEKAEIHFPAWTSYGGMLYKTCSYHYKIKPVRRKIRELGGYKRTKAPHPKAGEYEMWLGITTDEKRRQQKSIRNYVIHRYPLIEKNMSRDDCLVYLHEHGLPIPPRTSCVICPFRSPEAWIEVRDKTPGDWEKAILLDRKTRHSFKYKDFNNKKMNDNKLFVWRERIPLEEADFEEYIRRNGNKK